MKCDICGKKVEEIFLGKILGSHVKNAKGKKKVVCQNCQKILSMDEIKEKINA
jgi:hypothetical protein